MFHDTLVPFAERRIIIMEQIPILFNNKEECCGCTACYAVCPKHAIKMEEDEEGFEYPKIDSHQCISCFLCLSVCPLK